MERGDGAHAAATSKIRPGGCMIRMRVTSVVLLGQRNVLGYVFDLHLAPAWLKVRVATS